MPDDTATSNSWLTVFGSNDTHLATELAQRVAEHRASGTFTLDNQLYIRDVSLGVVRNEDFSLSGRRLELLRSLCSLHKVKLPQREITSHRPIVGRFIVWVKRVAYRVVRYLLEPMMHQQTHFNAVTIYLLAQLANEASNSKGTNERTATSSE